MGYCYKLKEDKQPAAPVRTAPQMLCRPDGRGTGEIRRGPLALSGLGARGMAIPRPSGLYSSAAGVGRSSLTKRSKSPAAWKFL